VATSAIQVCETDSMETFTAEWLAELKAPRIDWVSRVEGDRWLIGRPKELELLIVSAELEPTWRLRLPSAWGGRHAVNDSLSRVALSLRDEVLLLTGEGGEVARLAHPAWGRGASESGCCSFSPDQRYLWATAPTQAGSDELWLVDANEGELLDRRPLDASAAGCDHVEHPDKRTIGLSLGEGQDGSLIRWARPERDRIELRSSLSIDRVLVDVHPTGSEYLSTPHGNTEADELMRHRVTDDVAIDGLSAWDAFPFGGEWDLVAGYLTDELILAGVVPNESHVLVQREPMALLGTIGYPGDSRPGWIVSPRRGTWLTLNDEALVRWAIPSGVGSGNRRTSAPDGPQT
jgi:hypothetical protein